MNTDTQRDINAANSTDILTHQPPPIVLMTWTHQYAMRNNLPHEQHHDSPKPKYAYMRFLSQRAITPFNGTITHNNNTPLPGQPLFPTKLIMQEMENMTKKTREPIKQWEAFNTNDLTKPRDLSQTEPPTATTHTTDRPTQSNQDLSINTIADPPPSGNSASSSTLNT